MNFIEFYKETMKISEGRWKSLKGGWRDKLGKLK